MAKLTLATESPPITIASHAISRASSRTDFHIVVLPQYLKSEPRAQRLVPPATRISTAHLKLCPLSFSGSAGDAQGVISRRLQVWRSPSRRPERHSGVIPSMPGYGLSGKPTGHGLEPGSHRASLGGTNETPRLHENGPLNVIRLQRSPYGTSMPGAGAVHHIRLSGAMEKYPPGATENCPPRGVEDEGGF